MTVNYTTNLSLGQPVTGTESGTWGDDVNNAVTSYLDIAIAGGLAITVTTADVTLTITQGTSVATNIGSTTAQYAILNVSGAMTAARNLIVPSSSRIYLINNNTTGGFALTVKGSATSGVTLVNGEKAHVFWNGTDYAKMSNASGGAGVFSSITNSGLTSGRVVYSTTGGLETDSANLTFNGTTLTANTIGAFTLSGTIAGGGNQINNVIIGTTTPLAGAFTTLAASGAVTLSGGTANGVTYLNASKVLTSGSALTFDGSQLFTSGTLAITGGGASYGINLIPSDVAQGGKLHLSTGQTTNTSARNWALINSYANYGDLVLRVSNVLGGDPSTGGTTVFSATSSTIAFSPSGTEGMRLTSTGLGIGTSSPSYKLDVQTAATGTAAGDNTVMLVTSLASGRDANIRFGDSVNASARIGYLSGALYMYTNGSTRMTLDTSGNLGIGTSSPTRSLTIEKSGAAFPSTSNPTIRLNETSSGRTAIFELDSSQNLNIWNSDTGAGSIRFYRSTGSGTLSMTLDGSGNLGIGVTPSAWNTFKPISVGDTGSSIAGTANQILLTTNAYYSTGFIYSTTNVAAYYQQTTGEHRWFNAPSGTAGNAITFTQAMTLTAAGNLGLGITSADARLRVVGAGTNPGAIRIGYNGTSVNYIDADTNIFRTGAAAETMRIDSSGNVGIGTSSPSTYGKLAVSSAGAVSGYFENTTTTGSTTSTQIRLASYDGAAVSVGSSLTETANSWSSTVYAGGVANTTVLEGTKAGGVSLIAAGASAPVKFYTGGEAVANERMRIDSSGNLLVGTTSGITSGGIVIQPVAGQSTIYIGHITGTGSGASYEEYYYAGTKIGSITQTGTTAVLYNTTSDHRLKENIQDAAPASVLIDAIQVRQFNWKAGGSHQRYGFIAQELVTVAPEAVYAPADPDEMMAVDYSKLVPMLVKEIQSLRKRLTALEST